MIISASRRTDIPCYYSEWFIKRILEGYVYVRNPMNMKSVSRIDLSPSAVDVIVFWTKNPYDMLNKLDMLKSYMYYFQFTLNGYGRSIENNIPCCEELINTFKKLSAVLGKERVIWRYDPIILSEKFDARYHIEKFMYIATELSGYTDKVIVSFLDYYKKIQKKIEEVGVKTINNSDIFLIADAFSKIASENNMVIETCAEEVDLCKYGIQHGHCIDDKLISLLLGSMYNGKKDRNQRKECGCIQSVDVGAYNTCPNGCIYCYANSGNKKIMSNRAAYRVESPILCDEIKESDIITIRR